MDLSPFANLEARLNGSVQSRLANAEAVFQGGEPFGVIFTEQQSDDPMAETSTVIERTVSFPASCAVGIAEGDSIDIGNRTYTVSGPSVPDEGGWLVLPIYPA